MPGRTPPGGMVGEGAVGGIGRCLVGCVVVLAVVSGCTVQPAPPQPGGPDAGASAPDGSPAKSVSGPVRPRAAHTATLLPDGRVLLVGGCATDGCTTALGSPEVEFYRAGAGFVAGPAMGQPRDAHTATLLADGRVLVVGGFAEEGSAPLGSAEVFDPETDRFAPVGSLRTGRGGHVAALLADGRVLVAGGWVGPRQHTASVEIFDPETGRFEPGSPMPEPRLGAVATVLRDGRVLVTGGEDTPARGLATALTFEPESGRWQPVGSMSEPRFKHAAARLPDGRVLILGGTPDDVRLSPTTEVFDPVTNRFTPGPTMATGRYKIGDSVAVLADGGLVVAGGGTLVEVYRGTADGFAAVPDSSGPQRSFPTATTLPSGDILVVGGYDDRIRLNRDAFLVTADGARITRS